MPAGVLPGASRHTIPLTDQGAEGGRVPVVPLEGPIVAPRRQIFLPDVTQSLLQLCTWFYPNELVFVHMIGPHRCLHT